MMARSIPWTQVRKKAINIPIKILSLILIVCLSFILLYPVLYMVTISIRPPEELTNPASIWLPRKVTLDNFKQCIEVMKYPTALLNTFLVDVVGAMLCVVVCALAGYGFARFKIPFKGAFFALVIFTIMVPPQIIILPQFLQLNEFNFLGLNTIWKAVTGNNLSLINNVLSFYVPALMGQGIRAGLYIFIFRQFFSGLPKELEDSAYIDGAGNLKTFIRVMLPNAVPAMVTVSLFAIVWYWNDYFYATMYMPDRQTVSVALLLLKDSLSVIFGYGAISDPYMVATQVQAGCLLTIGPILILFLFLQRFFVESIERTGIVG